MGEFAKMTNDEAFIVPREGVYPVQFMIEPLVGQSHADPELYTSFESVAEPSVGSMMEQMRRAFKDRDIARATPDLMGFDHSTIGPRMLQVIEQIASEVMETSNG